MLPHCNIIYVSLCAREARARRQFTRQRVAIRFATFYVTLWTVFQRDTYNVARFALNQHNLLPDEPPHKIHDDEDYRNQLKEEYEFV